MSDKNATPPLAKARAKIMHAIEALDNAMMAGDIVAQGVTWHRTRNDAQAEVNALLDFLEAWSRERVEWGGV